MCAHNIAMHLLVDLQLCIQELGDFSAHERTCHTTPWTAAGLSSWYTFAPPSSSVLEVAATAADTGWLRLHRFQPAACPTEGHCPAWRVAYIHVSQE
jgi:hypothetical protein